MIVIVLMALAISAQAGCVAPPTNNDVCYFRPSSTVPSGQQSSAADNSLASFFRFLANDHALPENACGFAYAQYACSSSYNRCGANGNGLPVCRDVCWNFVYECEGQLPSVPRPDCDSTDFSDDLEGCTWRPVVEENPWYGSSANTLIASSAILMAFFAILATLAF
eukprot:CAMPEP_0201548512 /NCGR_PEP_ID=MMETSP0173_2-20130828/5060_1 /ASSEMBLY_ACC=CAM_ASM_000268 /TAXON_ID=218659 /ORGANISM="Vexillifera sp., Strain DIVA3 564/2" /LENGTH=165 /DNA_ID=CAMNT_0047957925 /DNA_START=155 /DNA_END=652 /DNA_ORIENTATION=+